MVEHTFNHSAREAEAGRYLCGWGRHGLHSLLGQPGLHIDIIFKVEIEVRSSWELCLTLSFSSIRFFFIVSGDGKIKLKWLVPFTKMYVPHIKVGDKGIVL